VALEIEMAWTSYREVDASAGRERLAGEFVREFVAQNFPALLDDQAPSSAKASTPAARPKRTRKR
jgi:hypothetical protein